MKIMSSGMSVFFIQNVSGERPLEHEQHAGVGASCSRYISPCSRSARCARARRGSVSWRSPVSTTTRGAWTRGGGRAARAAAAPVFLQAGSAASATSASDRRERRPERPTMITAATVSSNRDATDASPAASALGLARPGDPPARAGGARSPTPCAPLGAEPVVYPTIAARAAARWSALDRALARAPTTTTG